VVVFVAMLMLVIIQKGTLGRDDMPYVKLAPFWTPVDEQMT
jgi:hypothetical protein